MNPQKHTMSVLAQLASYLPKEFIQERARHDKIQSRAFDVYSQVLAMLYAHLAHALSLNDVCDSLHNHAGTLRQLGNAVPPSRNGLSHANRTREAGLAEDLFWEQYRLLYHRHPEFFRTSRNYPGLPHRFRRTLYAVDSTTIQLTADCMDWAKHRRQKAAAKLHVGLDVRSFLPAFVIAQRAKDSDPKTAWELCAQLRAGEIVTFDKAYVDFKHLNDLNSRGVFWVTRAKDNLLYEVVEARPIAPFSSVEDVGQQRSGTGPAPSSARPKLHQGTARAECPVEDVGQQRSRRRYERKACLVVKDELIRLTGLHTNNHYPQPLRLVTAWVTVKRKRVLMTFITNNLEWSPYTICELYQCRWGVEVFFKEIKQTLQLADFLGYSANAVRWQLWTALLAYLLLRFVAWLQKWRHPFVRLFTLLRATLWNFFTIASLVQACDTAREHRRQAIRGSPETTYQPNLPGIW